MSWHSLYVWRGRFLNSSGTGTTGVTPLNKTKHILIVAALAAAGAFVGSLVQQGVIDTALGSAIGAIIGEALIYEHSA